MYLNYPSEYGMEDDCNKPGLSNIRPTGQIRPVAWLDPAREKIL